MKLVIIESPYAGLVSINSTYARACIRYGLFHEESPIASHMLYTQKGVLNDNIASERQQGIDAGLAWLKVAEKSIVYTDLGISKGMKYGIDAAKKAGVEIEYRKIFDESNSPLKIKFVLFLSNLPFCSKLLSCLNPKQKKSAQEERQHY